MPPPHPLRKLPATPDQRRILLFDLHGFRSIGMWSGLQTRKAGAMERMVALLGSAKSDSGWAMGWGARRSYLESLPWKFCASQANSKPARPMAEDGDVREDS